MTITESFEQVMATAAFRDIAKLKNDKKGSYYRMLRTRYNRDTLKHGAMVDILLEHGYKVNVKKS
jgi:hypothetical protein